MLIQVRELQEIPAAELQQFAIKFVLGVREKNGKHPCLYNKNKFARWLEKQYFTHSLRLFVKYCFHHSKIKFISSRPRVVHSIYTRNYLTDQMKSNEQVVRQVIHVKST